MPGKSYIQKKYGHPHPLSADPVAQQRLLKQVASKDDKDKNGVPIQSRITAKQEIQFSDFHYGAPAFDSLITAIPGPMLQNTTLPFVTGSSAASSAFLTNGGSSHQLQARGVDKFVGGGSVDQDNMQLFPQQNIGGLMRESNSSNKSSSVSQSQGQIHPQASIAINNGGGGGGGNSNGSSLQVLTDNMKKSSITNQNASAFYSGHARPSTGYTNGGRFVLHVSASLRAVTSCYDISYHVNCSH
jgi:hypothetical protein